MRINVFFKYLDTNSKLLLTTGNASERITWLRKLEEARKHCLHIERMVLQRLRSSNLHFIFKNSFSLMIKAHEIDVPRDYVDFIFIIFKICCPVCLSG